MAGTLGRTLVTKTVSGSSIYYDVLNSQGTTSRFTVTTLNIGAQTNFGQAGVTEYSGGFTVIQSLALPDGTSYSFFYDHTSDPYFYASLSGITLPTGPITLPPGQIIYTYTNFADSYGNKNRWVNTRAAAGGTWTYAPAVISTCASGGVGCQQKVTVTRPSGDDTVYTFTLNNGAWNTQTDSYTGSSSGGGTLLRTVTTDYDLSNACPDPGCTGAAYIRAIRSTTSDPSAGGTTLIKKTEYSYDSPQYGNVTAIREWNYYTGTPATTPDRETDMTYLATSSYTNKNIIDRVTDKLVKDGSGTKINETATTYDSTTLTAITGIAHHDDTNFGTGNTTRGNPTVAKQWVSGTTYLSTTSYYDTTGQVTKVTDPAGNNTTYSYSDSFLRL